MLISATTFKAFTALIVYIHRSGLIPLMTAVALVYNMIINSHYLSTGINISVTHFLNDNDGFEPFSHRL